MYEREVPLFKQEHVLEAIAIALLRIIRKQRPGVGVFCYVSPLS